MNNMEVCGRPFTEDYRRETAGLVIDTGSSVSAEAKKPTFLEHHWTRG